MGKISTAVMTDGGLDKIATCIRLTVCAGQPTSYADITTKKLAQVTISSGDFTKANGDTSGRKVTVAQKSAISITTSGTADHVAIDDGTNYVITTATSQALTSGGTVTVPAWKVEIADPV
jgi:hypothetical protein